MIYTFLPVREDGYPYEKEEDILRYSHFVALSLKELNDLRLLYGVTRYYVSCPIIWEMLKHPLKITKDQGKGLRAGNYVIFLSEALSSKARALIHKRGGVLKAYLIDLVCLQYAVECLKDNNKPDNILYVSRLKNGAEIVETLFDSAIPFFYLFGWMRNLDGDTR